MSPPAISSAQPLGTSTTMDGREDIALLRQELEASQGQNALLQEQMLQLAQAMKQLQNQASNRSVSFDLSGPLPSVEEENPYPFGKGKGRARPAAVPLSDSDDEELIDEANFRRRPPLRQTPRQSSTFSGHSTMSIASRIEKIPNLHEKLSDGIEYSPKLWEVQIQNSLRRYQQYFIDDDHRKDWVLAQTDGMARTFLEPSFLEPQPDEDALDLVAQVVAFLTNPHESQTARNKYIALDMEEYDSFWPFYHEFRTLAKKSGMRDKEVLKLDLHDKIKSRLRKKLFHEYRKSRTLEEYVEAIQAEDQGQLAEMNVYNNKPLTSKTSSSNNKSSSSRNSNTSSNHRTERSSSHRDSRTLAQPSSSSSPHTRADTPRTSSSAPANTPRYFSSSQPPNRFPPRINEVDIDDSEQGDVEDNIEDNNNADSLVDEPTPRVKDQA